MTTKLPVLIELFDKEAHYPLVESWWIGHDWPPVPQAILPRLGALAVRDGVPIAAGWAYMDNSVGVSMLEWLVTNPEASPRDALRGLKTVVDFLKTTVKEFDYGVMLGTCRQESLSRLLQKQGFNVTDSGMIHHLAIIE